MILPIHHSPDINRIHIQILGFGVHISRIFNEGCDYGRGGIGEWVVGFDVGGGGGGVVIDGD